jgi:hypothetical protein
MDTLDIYTATDAQIMSSQPPAMTYDEVIEDSNVVEEDPVDLPIEDAESVVIESSSESEIEDPAEIPIDENSAEDATAQLAQLFIPFVANGKEIKIDSIEDARQLMQMGAGFNKKMAALKPHLKLIKMLEKNNLLDQDKLSHLIDISKNNPDAIGKLLAEGNIDPLNLTSGNTYTPNTYTVTDNELELDNVLADLQESAHYTQTLDVVVNKWDATSKQLLVSNPEIIRTIHDHVASGIFNQVTNAVERERVMGRLNGLSDLEAYKQVGDAMDAKGLFSKPVDKLKAALTSAPKQVSVDESKLKSRKLAASPTKSAPVSKMDMSTFNPLKMTDAEIMSVSIDKFL